MIQMIHNIVYILIYFIINTVHSTNKFNDEPQKMTYLFYLIISLSFYSFRMTAHADRILQGLIVSKYYNSSSAMYDILLCLSFSIDSAIRSLVSFPLCPPTYPA